MTHRVLLWTLLTVAGCQSAEPGATPTGPAVEHAPRPNVVVILCDDLGWGDLSSQGHPVIRTERLDRLAEEGVRFTSFYSAAPVCSPSRVGLLTGRAPGRAGIYDWIPPAWAEAPPRDDHRDLVHLGRDEPTLASLLRDDGYATCMVGKWHCNSRFGDPRQPQPAEHGFDHWFGTGNNAQPSHLDPKNFLRNGESVGALEGSACQLVVDEALGWLRQQQRSAPEQPFFLYVAFHEPHEPVAAPEELVELYLPQSGSRKEAEYFACVHNMDLATGRLLDTLDEMGLAEDTLVVFSSDNGPETLNRYGGADRSYGTPGPLRGMKLWTTEAGVRVPGIVRWPGTLPAGEVSDTVVSSLDLLPTICALAGVTPPPDRTLDGVDARAALHGGPLERETPLLWIYYNALNDRRVAMREGQWKLLARLMDENDQPLGKATNVHTDNAETVRGAVLTDLTLFHLGDDLAEAHDLALEQPEVLERLRALMERTYAERVDDSLVWRR